MSSLKKALLWAVSVIFISTTSYAGEIGHVPISLNTHTFPHIAKLKPTPDSFQLAKVTFLPEMQDSEISWSGREFPDDHNQGDNCNGYELTTCPSHGSCSSCPFDRRYKRLISCANGYTKSGNTCSASSCSAIGYESSIPANKICSKHTEGSLTCYKDCRAVSCSGYTLNCDTFNVANSASKATCPDCESASANCSPKLCKVSSCMDGFKIAENGTTCVALDDTCPVNTFKAGVCETGEDKQVDTTEAGTPCYSCKAKPVSGPKIGDILYSDLTVSSEVVAGKTPIGIVFDEEKKLAVALKDGGTMKWSTTTFDIPDLPNLTSSTDALSDWNGKNNTKTIVDYCKANSKSCPAAEYANSYTTTGTNAGDWYLPGLGELNAIYTNKTVLNSMLARVSGAAILPDSYHWSSSEYSNYSAWGQRFSDGNVHGNCNKNTNTFYVRPVINYGDVNKGLPY